MHERIFSMVEESTSEEDGLKTTRDGREVWDKGSGARSILQKGESRGLYAVACRGVTIYRYLLQRGGLYNLRDLEESRATDIYYKCCIPIPQAEAAEPPLVL